MGLCSFGSPHLWCPILLPHCQWPILTIRSGCTPPSQQSIEDLGGSMGGFWMLGCVLYGEICSIPSLMIVTHVSLSFQVVAIEELCKWTSGLICMLSQRHREFYLFFRKPFNMLTLVQCNSMVVQNVGCSIKSTQEKTLTSWCGTCHTHPHPRWRVQWLLRSHWTPHSWTPHLFSHSVFHVPRTIHDTCRPRYCEPLGTQHLDHPCPLLQQAWVPLYQPLSFASTPHSLMLMRRSSKSTSCGRTSSSWPCWTTNSHSTHCSSPQPVSTSPSASSTLAHFHLALFCLDSCTESIPQTPHGRSLLHSLSLHPPERRVKRLNLNYVSMVWLL